MRWLRSIDLANESVAFLHPLGGGWFSQIRSDLRSSGFTSVELTQRAEWPDGPENIGLSTMHSAKGLEFTHVVILGLNTDVMKHGAESDDSDREKHRRLLAMAITRARETVIVGYKPSEASDLIGYFDRSTYDEVVV